MPVVFVRGKQKAWSPPKPLEKETPIPSFKVKYDLQKPKSETKPVSTQTSMEMYNVARVVEPSDFQGTVVTPGLRGATWQSIPWQNRNYPNVPPGLRGATWQSIPWQNRNYPNVPPLLPSTPTSAGSSPSNYFTPSTSTPTGPPSYRSDLPPPIQTQFPISYPTVSPYSPVLTTQQVSYPTVPSVVSPSSGSTSPPSYRTNVTPSITSSVSTSPPSGSTSPPSYRTNVTPSSASSGSTTPTADSFRSAQTAIQTQTSPSFMTGIDTQTLPPTITGIQTQTSPTVVTGMQTQTSPTTMSGIETQTTPTIVTGMQTQTSPNQTSPIVMNAMQTQTSPIQTSPIVMNAMQTQTSPYSIQQHPEFFDTVTGIVAYEKALAQDQLDEKEKQLKMAQLEKNLYQDFVNQFLYSKFKVPIEMEEELRLLMGTANRVEGSFDDQGNFILVDSEFNRSLRDAINDWMNRAVQAGTQLREFTIDDITEQMQDYYNKVLRKRTAPAPKTPIKKRKMDKGKTSTRKPSPIKTSFENMDTDRVSPKPTTPEIRTPQSITPPEPGPSKRKPSTELVNQRKGKAPLRIDTNVRKVKGPRAPTRSTFPEIDKSNVTAANITSQKRTRRNR